MYSACMGLSEDLVRIDAAILDLRRSTDVPVGSPTFRHGVVRVEVSTVLVVDAVSRATDARRECSIGDVAAALQVVHSTASRLVDRAVKAAMITRDRAPGDPRRTVVALTREGENLQREAVHFRTGRLRGLLTDWSVGEVATFARLLQRFAHTTHTTHTMKESS